MRAKAASNASPAQNHLNPTKGVEVTCLLKPLPERVAHREILGDSILGGIKAVEHLKCGGGELRPVPMFRLNDDSLQLKQGGGKGNPTTSPVLQRMDSVWLVQA